MPNHEKPDSVEGITKGAALGGLEALAPGLQLGSSIDTGKGAGNIELPHLDLVRSASIESVLHRVISILGNPSEQTRELPKGQGAYDEARAEKNLQQEELHMVGRLAEYTHGLGLSESDADAVFDRRSQQIAKAGKVGQMILKSDLQGLEKLMADPDAKDVDFKLVSELLRNSGMNIRVEEKRGDLIISHPGDDFAVAIGDKGHARLLGITKGEHAQYYEGNFVDENPAKDLKAIVAKSQEQPKRSFWDLDPHYFLLNTGSSSSINTEKAAIRHSKSNMDAMLQPIDGLEEYSGR